MVTPWLLGQSKRGVIFCVTGAALLTLQVWYGFATCRITVRRLEMWNRWRILLYIVAWSVKIRYRRWYQWMTSLVRWWWRGMMIENYLSATWSPYNASLRIRFFIFNKVASCGYAIACTERRRLFSAFRRSSWRKCSAISSWPLAFAITVDDIAIDVCMLPLLTNETCWSGRGHRRGFLGMHHTGPQSSYVFQDCVDLCSVNFVSGMWRKSGTGTVPTRCYVYAGTCTPLGSVASRIILRGNVSPFSGFRLI